MIVTSVVGAWYTEDSPNCPGRVTDLGLDHLPGAINKFLDVEHRQRHGTDDPYRCLCDIEPRAYENDWTVDQFSRLFHLMVILTDPPAKPEDRPTRVWLRVVSQESFRVKLRGIGISSGVVQNLPV